MTDTKKDLGFSKIPGLFFRANHEIPNLPIESLINKYDNAMKKSDYDTANSVAEKICILYGVDGLSLYFNVSILLAQKNKQDNEIIDQEIIKVLSLVFFVEKNLPTSFSEEKMASIEKELVAICDASSKDEIISEAHSLCNYYINTVNTLN